MKTATVTEAKNGLSSLLRRVKAGESVLITDRGIPVARIEPIDAADDQSAQIDRLVRSGAVRPGTGRLPRGFLKGPTTRVPRAASVVDALIEERRTGR